jgi:hypothetical protein
MKIYKILSIILAIAVLQACDPLADELDGLEIPTTVVADIQYTLSDDDYDFVDEEFGSFSSEDDAKAKIPLILAENYPALGEGASAIITYDLYVGSAPNLSKYTGADGYWVSAADYAGADPAAGEAGFFNNTVTAADNIPGILDANISGPADGDLVAVTYEYKNLEYADISGKEIYAENFEGIADLSGFETFSLEGDESWYLYMSSSPYYAARMSGYNDGNQPNEDWLILPEVDLTDFNEAAFKLSHVVNFCFSCTIGTDVAVKISTDYAGDPSTATWSDLSLDKWPSGDSYDIVNSEASLAAYGGQKVTIAFYYKSTADHAAQWRIVDVLIDQGELIETIRKNQFYEYSSSDGWESVDEGVYYLSSADYDVMGDPGRFDNFSSSDPADNYLPAFLRINFPYAQEEDEIYIIYKYYSSSAGATQTRGDLYSFLAGAWEKYQSVIAKNLSFGHDGNVWVPDNTIKYSLKGADYVAIAAATESTNPSGSNSMGTYGNVDVGLWTEEQIIEAIGNRLLEIFPVVEGQKYLVSYDTWEPGAGVRTIHLILVGGVYVKVE